MTILPAARGTSTRLTSAPVKSLNTRSGTNSRPISRRRAMTLLKVPPRQLLRRFPLGRTDRCVLTSSVPMLPYLLLEWTPSIVCPSRCASPALRALQQSLLCILLHIALLRTRGCSTSTGTLMHGSTRARVVLLWAPKDAVETKSPCGISALYARSIVEHSSFFRSI